MKTKSQAIKHARKMISKLYRFGNQYRFDKFDEEFNCWSETLPKDYWKAVEWRRYCLLMEALCYLHGKMIIHNLPPAEISGRWTDYVK